MERVKWEYKKVIYKGTEGRRVIEVNLNSLGNEGWELVDVVAHIYKTNATTADGNVFGLEAGSISDSIHEFQMQTFYFKRPKLLASDIVFTSDLKKTTENNIPGGSA